MLGGYGLCIIAREARQRIHRMPDGDAKCVFASLSTNPGGICDVHWRPASRAVGAVGGSTRTTSQLIKVKS
jgi:hypothetical protein